MKNTRGFTLFETIIYIALLSGILLLITEVLFGEIHAFLHARADRNATDSASTILERLTQEVRLARSVVVASSTLGSSPGHIVLQSYITPTSTILATVDITLTGTDVTIQRNTNASITLAGTHVRITELIFNRLSSSSSEMLRMTITVESGTGRFQKEKQFTTAAVLRGSY